MSNLGGNSPSADTDKSNNLTGNNGAPGADGVVQTVVGGTNCTVDATDINNPIVNAEGQVESVVGGTNTTVDNTDPKNPVVNVTVPSASPTTTKGDVIARGASADERVAVGTDGQHLIADSASSAGVKWETPAAGGGDPLTTKGDLFGFDTDANRIPVGTNDQVLTADSTASLGVAWKDAASGGGAVSAAFIEEDSNEAHGSGFQVISFDTEVYDDNDFADLGTNDDRLTVPTGVTRVNVCAYLELSGGVAAGTANRMSIRHKNSGGTTIREIAGHSADHFYDTPRMSCTALGVPCAAGDYFEILSIFEDSSVNLTYRSFSIQTVS